MITIPSGNIVQGHEVIEIPNLLTVSIDEARMLIDDQKEADDWGRDGF